MEVNGQLDPDRGNTTPRDGDYANRNSHLLLGFQLMLLSKVSW